MVMKPAEKHEGGIGKMRRFSLLFAHGFPVTPKSFPVNFYKEFRSKPIWMLHLVMILSTFQPSFSDFPCIFPCYLGIWEFGLETGPIRTAF
jgi:hypothetical protein